MISVQDIVQILQTEYPNSWNKRWRKLSKYLKESFKENPKKIRFVDFGRKQKSHPYDINSFEVPDAAALTKRSSSSWNSTIRGVVKKDEDGIKKVQLNYNGSVDSPKSPNPLEIINESGATKTEKIHSAHSKSEGIITTMAHHQRARSVSAQLGRPSALNHSKSVPKSVVIKKEERPKHKKAKTSMFSSFFIKRNSLDRNNAIQRSVRKRAVIKAKSVNTSNPSTVSFYDHNSEFISSSRDSSDDSNDIVPHEDWNETELTAISPQLSDNISDILVGADNAGKAHKTVPRKVTFHDMKKQHRRQQSGGGGRKGGKFGGKKRNVASRKKVSPVAKHRKVNSYNSKKSSSKVEELIEDNLSPISDNLQVIGDMIAVPSLSTAFEDNESSNDSQEARMTHQKTETKIVYGDEAYIQSPVNEEEMIQIDVTPIMDANDEFVSIDNTEKVQINDDDDDDTMFMNQESTML